MHAQNGSGKSNILDAICFVLGITNLQTVCGVPATTRRRARRDSSCFQVRAANLQDLIYKRGQAGITKASVTIVFDNSDRDKAPIGFEGYKQITVTRQVSQTMLSRRLHPELKAIVARWPWAAFRNTSSADIVLPSKLCRTCSSPCN